jgi:hypothetical protein
MLLTLLGALAFIALSILIVIVFIRFCGVKKAEWLVNEIEHRQGFTQIVIVLVMLMTCAVYLWQGSIASDTEQRSLRAYVSFKVDKLQISNDPTVPTVAYFTISNDGQTPAYNLSYQLMFGLHKYPLDGVQNWADSIPEGTPIGTYLGPHASTEGHMAMSGTLSQEQIRQLSGNETRLFLGGTITYADAFQVARHLRVAGFFGGSEMKTPDLSIQPNGLYTGATEGQDFEYDPKNNFEF